MNTSKKTHKLLNTILTGTMITLAGTSCTNLDEKVFHEIDAETYYQDSSAVLGAVAAIYNSAASGFLEYFWYLNEFPADQVTWRTWHGGEWGWDEAAKFVVSSQTWTPDALIIQQAWEHAWETIGKCNLLIDDLNNLKPESIGMTAEEFASYIAEVRTMRAWAYYNNFELWGGSLPLNTSSSNGDIPGSISTDFNEGCKLMWQFIADELDACWEQMSVENGGGSTRLKLNQGMNRMLKMRLLLNSELWTDVDRYSECATLAQEIIDGKYGSYQLAQDYRKIYDVDNVNCPEIIFAFAMKDGNYTNNNRNTPWLPYNYTDILGGEWNQSGWNCVVLVPSQDNSGTLSQNNDYTTGNKSFIFDYGDKLGAPFDRLNEKDIRRQPFHSDAQGNWEGCFLMGAQVNYFTGQPVPADAEIDGLPLYYTDQVGTFNGLGHELEDVMSPRWGMTNSGYRFLRYPIIPESTGLDWRNAAQVEFRLAEVYYTLAECKLRKGETESAKQLVNQVRQRYYDSSDLSQINNPGPGFSAFDMDWMLSEWGLEYLDEGRRRRTDLRRFDKFTQGQWWFFGRVTDPERQMPAQRDRKYEWYPLPARAIAVNPGLVQNPNYINN